ncbi:MAG: hypothetical protein V4635_12065 [Bacteroidota bacterium]
MKNFKCIPFFLVLFIIGAGNFKAQVKIGDNPNTINANSMLELESSNKGFLPPRVALQSVTSPSPLTAPVPTGMIVYSSNGSISNGCYMWSGSKWQTFSMDNAVRNNFVLVKSAADLPAPVGGVITLVAGTLYEINGTVTLSDRINLNGCNLQGDDAGNDKIIYSGSAEMFTGSGVGNISYLTLTAPSGNVFNVNAGGLNKNFLVQNCFIIGCNAVGTIQGVGGTVFFSTVAYFYNTNGIVFQNDNNVVLTNTLWDITNYNVYEKFIGAFNVIQILGGDRLVNSGNSATAIHISGITSVISASIKVVMFVGTGTYVVGTFSNAWEVEASGINTEKDDVAAGNLYISSAATTVISATGVPVKVSGTTTAASLFRVTSPVTNRLTYTGSKTKRFQVICSLTATQVSSNKYFSFYIAKNGVILPESRQEIKILSSSDQGPLTLSCTVPLAPNDYIEVWVENETSSTDLTVQTMNLGIK